MADRAETLTVVAYLERAYSQKWDGKTKAAWVDGLADCRPDLLRQAAREMVQRWAGFPTVAKLRAYYRPHAERRALEEKTRRACLPEHGDPEVASKWMGQMRERFGWKRK